MYYKIVFEKSQESIQSIKKKLSTYKSFGGKLFSLIVLKQHEECPFLDEQIRIHRIIEVDAFDDFFFFDTHDVHGHRAVYHLYAHFLGLGDHGRQSVAVLLFHDGFDHLGAGVARQHDVEHSFHAAFGDADFLRTFDDVKSPESKEHRHLFAVRYRSIGGGEESQRLVKVTTEDDHRCTVFCFLQDRYLRLGCRCSGRHSRCSWVTSFVI